MELSDKEIRRLARLSRDRGLYAECKGADLDALQELGLLQWFDARPSTMPFKEDPRPLFKLLGITGRIDFFWVETVETGASLSGQKSLLRLTQSTKSNGALNSGPFTGAVLKLSRQGLATSSLDCISELSIKLRHVSRRGA